MWGKEKKMSAQQMTFAVPAVFLEMAAACGESLPALINATVEIVFIGDNWEASVISISQQDGSDMDQSWLDENAGYDLTMRQQIKLLALQDCFPGRY